MRPLSTQHQQDATAPLEWQMAGWKTGRIGVKVKVKVRVRVREEVHGTEWKLIMISDLIISDQIISDHIISGQVISFTHCRELTQVILHIHQSEAEEEISLIK